MTTEKVFANTWGEWSRVQTVHSVHSAAVAILKYTVVLTLKLSFVLSGGTHKCKEQIKYLQADRCVWPAARRSHAAEDSLERGQTRNRILV